jgi:pimeloyl-ACP methyl ester carboxylesterase
MLSEKSFDTGEIVMNLAEGEPTGKPLVLLHGGTQSWRTWKWMTKKEFLHSVTKSWHVYAPDLRGHGKSGRTGRGYVYEDFLPDVTALIERQVGEPAVLIGFSFGASVALGVGARRPDLVRAMILLEPELPSARYSDPGSFVWVDEMLTWLRQTQASARSVDDVVDRCRERWPVRDENERFDVAHAVYNLDPQFIDKYVFEDYRPELLLPRLECPTLLVYGEPRLGSIINDADVELFKKDVPHGRAVHIADVGHGVISGAPGQAGLKCVTQFLSSL